MRFFEVIQPYGKIPTRATSGSAGYDFYAPSSLHILPNETVFIQTGIRAKMNKNEVLLIYVRSSIGIKKGLVLGNGTGVIDSDYYDNPSNQGEIGICLKNTTNNHVYIDQGERIAQGVFIEYLTVDDDAVTEKRGGGFGSTN